MSAWQGQGKASRKVTGYATGYRLRYRGGIRLQARASHRELIRARARGGLKRSKAVWGGLGQGQGYRATLQADQGKATGYGASRKGKATGRSGLRYRASGGIDQGRAGDRSGRD